MKYGEIRKAVKDRRNGTFMSLTYDKMLPVRAAYKDKTVYRKTTVVVRCGVEYNNITSVIDKRKDGNLPKENEGLPWGKWKEYPYFIEHNGKTYLRCATVKGAKPNSVYYVDGVQTDKDKISSIIRKESSNDMDIFTINIDNIVSVA